MEPAPSSPPIPDHLMLFDGVCGLCDRTVQFFLERDPEGNLTYAPLQGDLAAALRETHPEITGNVDTIVYIEHGRAYVRSEGVLRAMANLKAPWRWARVLRIVPLFLRDFVYERIARNRYSIWGKYDSCKLPSEEQAARFLA